MDRQLEELQRAQREGFAKLEARLDALERENAALREMLVKKDGRAPTAPAGNTWAQGGMQPSPPGGPRHAPAAPPLPSQATVPPNAGNVPPYAPQGQPLYGATYAPPGTPARPPYPHAAFTGLTTPAPRQKPQRAGVEMRIGRITGIVGLVFILVGVVLGLRYTYMHLLQSDWLKLGTAYLLGLLFLGGGELLSRRGKNAFSLSLLAGGVGICLATTAAGYFNLRALPALAACGVCVLVAAVALLLAMLHKSQLIAVFALVGGYMPMLAVDGMLTGPAKIYLLFLNFLVLFLAVDRDWRVLKCLSLACNTAALVYLFGLESVLSGGVFTPGVVWGLVYLLGCFIIYMAMCLLLAVRQKRNLADFDTVLIAVNTWVHFLLAQWVLVLHGVPRAGGAIALALSAGFWFFARASKGFLPRDHSARGLFYANSFALLPIGIALLLRGDVRLYALLAAGAGLWCAGIYVGKKWYSRAGGGIFALGLLVFVQRYGHPVATHSPRAILPFAVVVVLGLLVLVAVLSKYRKTVDTLPLPAKGFWQGYQAAVLAVLVFYIVWLAKCLFNMAYTGAKSGGAMPAWPALVQVMLLFLLPLGLRRIRYLRAKGTAIVALGYTAFGFLLSAFPYSFRVYNDAPTLLLLAVLYLTALACIARALRALPGNALPGQWVAATVLSLALYYLSVFLVNQLQVAFNGMLLSVLYLLAALACVVFGFARRKTMLRRYGLMLLYLATTKLFLLDLAFLPSGQRIVSYFLFGFALLGISWVYQRYEKGLKEEMEEQ